MITCAHCRTPMPSPTGRASRKRFCTTECRKAAWRERHRNDAPTDTDVVPDVVPGIVADVVPGALAVPTAFPDDVPNHGGQHRCPHCRQPLAILSVVIPADAAIVRIPEVPPTNHTSANLNRHLGKMI